MTQSLVSIIVPVYKVEKELSRCVDSLLKQTYKDIEIILVDDGSPDKCPELCDEYGKMDNRVRVIHKKNGGLSDARNEGFKKATGSWIMYVDSDDTLELDAVEHFINAVKNVSKPVDIVIGAVREISLDGKISFQRHTNLELGTLYSPKEYILKSAPNKEFYAPACLNFCRKDYLDKINQDFKVGIYYEDLDHLLKIFLPAQTILYTDYPFYNYIKREGSITNSNNISKIHESAKIVLSDIFQEIKEVTDSKLNKVLSKWFTNIYLCMIGNLKIEYRFFPNGMNKLFLIKHCPNMKDFIKLLIFLFSQRLYVKIYQNSLR